MHATLYTGADRVPTAAASLDEPAARMPSRPSSRAARLSAGCSTSAAREARCRWMGGGAREECRGGGRQRTVRSGHRDDVGGSRRDLRPRGTDERNEWHGNAKAVMRFAPWPSKARLTAGLTDQPRPTAALLPWSGVFVVRSRSASRQLEAWSIGTESGGTCQASASGRIHVPPYSIARPQGPNLRRP